MKHSLTDLTWEEAQVGREAILAMSGHTEEPPVDDEPDEPPAGDDEPIEPPDEPAVDALEVAMQRAHDDHPKLLFGFEIRKRNPRWIASARERPNKPNEKLWGESEMSLYPLPAWEQAVAFSGGNYLSGPEPWRTPLFARLAALAAARNHGIGLRLKPNRPGKYRWAIDYGTNNPGAPQYTVPDQTSLTAAVDAYERGDGVQVGVT